MMGFLYIWVCTMVQQHFYQFCIPPPDCHMQGRAGIGLAHPGISANGLVDIRAMIE